jgi:4-diphosphocytidyl-2-C-methyl-D-erythritol kinase
VEAIKRLLIAQGALYAAMSGSGSSVFGLFAEAPTSAMLQAHHPHFVFSAPL